ncbi:dimodular nonribosomal peptide synthetase domain protein [Anopheles sinensis]|uniref:Dimodular nonribosomal peptide synthetase domain protein n=1 Tax=Anopheles sinensis TaxID=74873 RepID=A0A084VS72_ANOSI|nr:dimodular nonribosomal peptide synthetase domain protein [Anopheles sinensis]
MSLAKSCPLAGSIHRFSDSTEMLTSASGPGEASINARRYQLGVKRKMGQLGKRPDTSLLALIPPSVGNRHRMDGKYWDNVRRH